jgi:hypothetical protein
MYTKDLFGKLSPPGYRVKKGWYKFEGVEAETPSVTTINKVLNKFQLIPWAAWCEREFVTKIAADVHDNYRYSSRDSYLVSLGMKLGRGYGYTNEISRTQKIGVETHAAIEAFLKDGTVSECALFGKWKKWWDEMVHGGLQQYVLEQTLYSPRYNFAGTADLIGQRGEGTIIIDWKTSEEVRIEQIIQIGGYHEALKDRTGIEAEGCVVCVPREEDQPVKATYFTAAEAGQLGKIFLAVKAAWEAEREAQGILKAVKKRGKAGNVG